MSFEDWVYKNGLILFNMILFLMVIVTAFRGTTKIKTKKEGKEEIYINKSKHSIIVFLSFLGVWTGFTSVMIIKAYM